jgi:hypothetical protein
MAAARERGVAVIVVAGDVLISESVSSIQSDFGRFRGVFGRIIVKAFCFVELLAFVLNFQKQKGERGRKCLNIFIF